MRGREIAFRAFFRPGNLDLLAAQRNVFRILGEHGHENHYLRARPGPICRLRPGSEAGPMALTCDAWRSRLRGNMLELRPGGPVARRDPGVRGPRLRNR